MAQTYFDSGSDMFEYMLGDINYDQNSKAGRLYPFKVRVGCIRRRPPRHKFFEFILDLGRLDVEKILEKKSLGTKTELTLVFPERWMGVHEQRSLMSNLLEHQDVVQLKQVDILTSSPLLISSFMKEHIRILTWKDDIEG